MVSRYEDFIRDIVITIHMNLHELDERRSFADPEELCHIEGKLMAQSTSSLVAQALPVSKLAPR